MPRSVDTHQRCQEEACNRVVRERTRCNHHTECSIQGCSNNCRGGAQGWCKLHYTRFCRTGDPLGLKSTRGRAFGLDRQADLERRFLKGIVPTPDGHILFTGEEGWIDEHGYGRIGAVHLPYGQMMAHRFAWEYWVGPIEDGKHLDHNPQCPKNCVNVEHLTPLNQSEHSRLSWERGECTAEQRTLEYRKKVI